MPEPKDMILFHMIYFPVTFLWSSENRYLKNAHKWLSMVPVVKIFFLIVNNFPCFSFKEYPHQEFIRFKINWLFYGIRRSPVCYINTIAKWSLTSHNFYCTSTRVLFKEFATPIRRCYWNMTNNILFLFLFWIFYRNPWQLPPTAGILVINKSTTKIVHIM